MVDEPMHNTFTQNNARHHRISSVICFTCRPTPAHLFNVSDNNSAAHLPPDSLLRLTDSTDPSVRWPTYMSPQAKERIKIAQDDQAFLAQLKKYNQRRRPKDRSGKKPNPEAFKALLVGTVR